MNGSSFVQGAKEAALETRLLPVYTLDTLYQEGFELEVLKGAQTLMDHTEIFILEASLYPFMEGVPMAHELITFMADHQYYLYDVAGWMRRIASAAALKKCSRPRHSCRLDSPSRIQAS